MGTVRLAGALLPSCAVLLGLYGLGSAWAAVLLYHFGIVAFAILTRGRCGAGNAASHTAAGSTDQRASWRRWLVPAVLMGALAGPSLYLLWPWLEQSGVTLTSWLAERGMQGWTWRAFALYYGLVHPVLEEWHWEQIGVGLSAGPHITDVFFAGYHVLVLATLIRWPWLILVFCVLLSASVFWRWMYRSRETRYVPVLSHGVADLSIILAASLLLLAGR